MRTFLFAGGVLLALLSVAAPPIVLLTLAYWHMVLRYDKGHGVRQRRLAGQRATAQRRMEVRQRAALRSLRVS